MELNALFEEADQYRNQSDINEIAVSQTLLELKPAVAIPYLVILTIIMVVGCVGNTLVIAAVLTNKVSLYLNV